MSQLKLGGRIEAVIKSDVETDARLLDLRFFPLELTMDFEDILELEPVIDYSDMDEEFDPDREDTDADTDADTDCED